MSRRGVALLLVLGALLLVTTAVSTSVLSASTHLQSDQAARAQLRAADLLQASEVIVDQWLVRESVRVVADPSFPEPRVDVADIAFDDNASSSRIELTAWDLRGMPPAHIPASHPLSRFVGSRDDAASAQSLAQLADPLAPVHPTRDAFASRLGGRAAVYRSENRLRISNSVILNVNTAPADVLRVAMRTAQRGDIESVLAARSQGIPSPAPRSTRESSTLVQLIGRSNLWAVRADITVGPITRSWWTVYESQGRGWSIIDRHEIAD